MPFSFRSLNLHLCFKNALRNFAKTRKDHYFKANQIVALH